MRLCEPGVGAVVLIALLLAAPALAQYGRQPAVRSDRDRPAALRDVGFDQRLGEQVPLELPLRDESGRDVRLGDYFSGKPVILVLAQFRCPMLCNEVLNGLSEALRKIAFSPGEQYHVVVVSFDARETPEMAAAKKETYVAHYARPGAADGWHFLTGPQEAIDRLTEAVGFRYRYDAEKDQFVHPSGVVVLTPQGRLARYFFRLSFSSPRDLRLALVEASEQRIGSTMERIMLFCFHYDATAGKYTVAVRNLVRAGGVVTLLALGAFVLRSRRRNSLLPSPPASGGEGPGVRGVFPPIAEGQPPSPQPSPPEAGGEGDRGALHGTRIGHAREGQV